MYCLCVVYRFLWLPCATAGKGLGLLLKVIGKILGNGESCKETWYRVN